MTVMAVFQDVDKCMRCNGCVIACKRTWGLKNPDTLASVVEGPRMIVSPRQRLAIKSQKRVDMGPFIRFTCWHCPDPPCAKGCPLGAIKREETGAVSINNDLCNPAVCNGSKPGPKPCEIECQRGGYPKVGEAYIGLTDPKANKCTLCHGRAGSEAQVVAAGHENDSLPTTATQAEIDACAEKAHQPACVSTCPAKAMKWESRDVLITYLNDPANGFILADGTKNWLGNGSMFWASKKTLLAPPKADPFIEDHIAPMVDSLSSSMGGKLLLPTLVLGGLAALSARRVRNETAFDGGEV